MSQDPQRQLQERTGVWITAYGCTNVVGNSVAELRSALLAGTSGLSTAPVLPDGFTTLPFPACLGAVPFQLDEAPHLAPFPDTRQLRMAWMALRQIQPEVEAAVRRFGADRVGLILGTSTGGILSTEEALNHALNHGTLPNSYSCLDGHAMDAAVRHIAQTLKLRGPAFATSSACASGAKAIASAKRLIECGLLDAVLSGGVDSLARVTIFGFHSLGVLSADNCRPFDDTSFGMNVAEGGAWLLIERSGPESESEPLASILGIGESSDAYHMSAPDPTGHSQKMAMTAALADADLTARDILYVNAHGTGTKANDSAEKSAILATFDGVAASSTKGLLGHQLGAAGATEAIVAAEVAQGLAICADGALDRSKFPLAKIETAVLSNSFAFGGANISLAIDHAPVTTNARDSQTGLRARVVAMNALSLHPEFNAISSIDPHGRLPLDPETIGAEILGSRGRARASELTRLFAECVAHLGLTKEHLAGIPLFIGSALGQIQTSKHLIELFLKGDSSPLAFQGSVHNAAAGVLSIALSNKRPSSSIAAGADTLFATLIEAMSYLNEQDCSQVLVIVGDERPPKVLGLPDFAGAATALLLERTTPETPGAHITIQPRRSTGDSHARRIVTPAALMTHICGEGLGVVEFLLAAQAGESAVVNRPNNESPWEILVHVATDAPPSILELLPHQPPLVLLEKVLSFDEHHMTCLVDLKASQIFSSDDHIDVIIATEWMAQAVGAFVGAQKRVTGQSPRIGFIIGARKVDFHVSKVNKDSVLRVSAEPVWVDRASGSFNCTVTDILNNKVIAEGSLTVHEPEH